MSSEPEATNDPAELIEMAQVRESAGGLKAPPMDPIYDEGKKQWRVTVPNIGTGGAEVFRGESLEKLVATLALAKWHATNLIRHQVSLLKDKFRDSSLECFGEILPRY